MSLKLVALRLQVLSDGGGSAFGDAGSMVGGTVVDSTVISDRQFKVLGKLASGGEGQDDEKLNLHLRIQQPEGECGHALPRSGSCWQHGRCMRIHQPTVKVQLGCTCASA